MCLGHVANAPKTAPHQILSLTLQHTPFHKHLLTGGRSEGFIFMNKINTYLCNNISLCDRYLLIGDARGDLRVCITMQRNSSSSSSSSSSVMCFLHPPHLFLFLFLFLSLPLCLSLFLSLPFLLPSPLSLPFTILRRSGSTSTPSTMKQDRSPENILGNKYP